MPRTASSAKVLVVIGALLAAVPCHCTAEATPRIVSLGDLHGDFRHAVALLEAAGLVEEGTDADRKGPDGRPFSHYRGARWVGGNATLVQTGDVVDRGTFARDLYALFQDLRPQAAAAGGRVVNLIGNHESMNLQGDLRYVTHRDTAEFGGVAARRAAFGPKGWVGHQILEEFQATFLAGDTLFVHAGLLPEHVEHGIERLNSEFKQQLEVSLSQWRGGRGPLLQASGPVWLRRLTKAGSECPLLTRVLELTGARRMVVGHTQVEEGSVRPLCEGRLLMADTIISKNGYPECWLANSMQTNGCQGSLSYVELRGREAVAIRVRPPGTKEGAAMEEVPLALGASTSVREL